MNRIQLFRTLRHHIKLSEKRSLAYEQNRIAKVFLYILSGFVYCYMVFIAVMLALAANSSSRLTPYELFFGLLPFSLTIDFLFRFIAQQTPAQLIKPYSLLPIPKYACVESFILSSIMTPNNLIWMAITVPFAIMSILFSYGFWAAVGFVVFFQLIVVINSQHYMFWRTLINKHILFWIGPIVIYGLMFLPWILKNFMTMFRFYEPVGQSAVTWNPLAFLAVLAILAGFFFVNRRMQYVFTYQENSGESDTTMKTVSEFHQLDRFGQIGEYLKLEVKSIMRNKNVRNSVIFGTLFTIFLSATIAYTDIYDAAFISKFWLVYVFVLSGATILIKIMCFEGNYIDCLMAHRENILQLLHAKYYFFCTLLFIPFLIMLPTVFMGKYTLLMLLSMMIFTAGPIYCLLMQMAVYNRQTIPLNTKLVSKMNVETNWFQVIAEFIVMFAPILLISILMLAFSETTTYVLMLIIGLAFIAGHKIWLRNIYKRFMKRRYKNMDSFRATR